MSHAASQDHLHGSPGHGTSHPNLAAAPGASPERQDPSKIYRERCERFAAERDRSAERALWVSHARVATFLTAAFFLIAATTTAPPVRAPLIAAGALFLTGFAVLVYAHARARARLGWFDILHRVNNEAAARQRRDWSVLPAADPPIRPSPSHAYAADLDLFGHASLFQLLGTAAMVPGRSTLARWLLAPAAPESIVSRQEAVTELAPMLDLRDELTAHGRLMGRVEPTSLEHFLRWAEDRPWLLDRPWLVWLTRSIPVLTIGLIGLDLAGESRYAFWLLPVAAALALTRAAGRNVRRTFGGAGAGEVDIRRYAASFALVSHTPLRARRLRHIQDRLSADNVPADRHIRRLAQLVHLADLRRSIPYLLIQLLTLWDFHVVYALERWQRAAGTHVRAWFSALGEAEALAALGALAHAHPEWAFPELTDDPTPVLEAKALAHPLLPRETAVANDVAIGPPGTFLLVTGSNMSGKSTLLRAIGTNVVLAQAGGPACATRLRLPRLELYTSMRIQDSLEQGLSQFMAELRRVKDVVDAARRARADAGRTLLYLLDELLRGTNTVERQVASRRILRHLLDNHAIGAITTHDLELANTDALAAAARPVHFRETVDAGTAGPVLSFDYVLRPGLATSTNALTLLEIVGLKD